MGKEEYENQEAEVYEEWRTYPPVPDLKAKNNPLCKVSENSKLDDRDSYCSKN